MLTQEIPRNEWPEFFNRFSRQHEGWLVTLEVFSPDFGAQEEVHDLPLEGIAISENDNAGAIAISAGKTSDDHLTHTVVAPLRVWIEKTFQGADEALEIESEDDTKTLLRFRSAVPPEMVDGVVLD
jgi:Family of unknown function (DUF5335)